MSGNANLGAARRVKNDEFYTQLADIENELKYYREHFSGARVLCNCDDPYESNFTKYFIINFERLGLAELVCTCYAGSPVASARDGAAKPYKLVVTTTDGVSLAHGCGVDVIDAIAQLPGNYATELDGDGDFASDECLSLLDSADIVVSNPPFSLARAYVATLMRHKKRFLIIGNQNWITYKEMFPLLKGDEMWLGVTHPKRFLMPSGSMKTFGNINWFTNLDVRRRHEELLCMSRYAGHEDEYPRYENFDAIEVSRVNRIPGDYPGLMGVPITFFENYNPDQFDIVGYSRELATPIREVAKPDDVYQKGGNAFYLRVGEHELRRLYGRIVIRHKR